MAYTREQRAIIALSRRLSAGLPARVRQALLEAEAVESNFRNLHYGDRDSQGVLQQRPSTGWGPAGNAAVDIRQFLQRALAVNRGFRGSAGQLAQAVQRSAFPGRYDQHAGEAARLLGGHGTGAISQDLTMPAPGMSGPNLSSVKAQLAQSLIAANQATSRGQRADYAPVLEGLTALHSAENAAPASSPQATVPGSTATPQRGGPLSELFYDPLGAIKNGRRIPAIGGHSDHVHIASMNEQTMLAAIAHAEHMGLHVGENPLVGRVNPVHTTHSNHYKVIGSYRGRKVGAAADISGSPTKMAAFFRWAARNL